MEQMNHAGVSSRSYQSPVIVLAHRPVAVSASPIAISGRLPTQATPDNAGHAGWASPARQCERGLARARSSRFTQHVPPVDPSPEPGPDPLAAIRAARIADGLDRADLDADPMVQFRRWFDDAIAIGVHEPGAMALATADAEGHPSVRLVLLRGLDERGLVFYTNRESRKADDLAATPFASIVMAWHAVGRQARVSGGVELVADDESDAYFAGRPRGHQISAWASPQSGVIADRAELERRLHEREAALGDGPVPRPPFWGGYRIVPSEVEFWQQRDDRFHDRFRYRRADPAGRAWIIERLGP
jgi:pyridoxamine 5'-phosphate oxidase